VVAIFETPLHAMSEKLHTNKMAVLEINLLLWRPVNTARIYNLRFTWPTWESREERQTTEITNSG
jgi:hypothetical protein